MKRSHLILLTIATLVAATLAAVVFSQPAAAASRCVVRANDGSCGPYDSPKITLSNGFNTYVANNKWACGPSGPACGPQKVAAYGPSRWKVVSRQRARNTQVLTYPDIQQLFTKTSGEGRRVRSFRRIHSYYRESMPHNGRTIAQAAYDIWLGHTNGPDEVMIWVDNVNRGTGGARVLRHATFANKRYTLMRYGSGELIWSRNRNAHRGNVPILPMLRWLTHHHFESTRTTINQVDFGWEICSTGGVRETFKVRNFTLRSRRR